MTHQQMLLLVLIAIYLSECFVWVGHGAVAFRSALGRWFKPVDPPIFPGSDRGGWAFLNLLPPFGSVFVCHQWPLALTADQVGPQTGQSVNFTTRPHAEAVVLPWQAAGKVQVHGRSLMLVGEPVARLTDEPAADHFQALLVRLAAVAPDQREAEIKRAIVSSFNTKLVEERLSAYRRSTTLLRLLCVIFFFLLFVLMPVAVYLGRFSELVYRVLPMLLGTWLLLLINFYIAHRRLLPNDRLGRWKALVTMVFTPTAGIRACDVIGRRLLTGFDPIAVAAVLCKDTTFKTFAERVVQDLRYPLPAVAESPLDSNQAQIAADFRRRLLEQVEKVMAQRGLDTSALTTVPMPVDPTLRSYCPRCRLEYMVESGTCRDCGDRKLESMASIEGKQYAGSSAQ